MRVTRPLARTSNSALASACPEIQPILLSPHRQRPTDNKGTRTRADGSSDWVPAGAGVAAATGAGAGTGGVGTGAGAGTGGL